MSPAVAVVPRRTVTSVRRGPALWLFLCGVLLVSAIAIGTAVMIGEFRERALSNSERELENAVLLLTRHFDQQFEDSDVIARNLISQMHFAEIASPEAFSSQMSTPEAHALLQSRVSVFVLYRRRADLRCRRQADQFVGDLAATALQRCRSRLFQGVQIGPAIGDNHIRTGSQLHHRRLDHGDRAPADRSQRGFPRRDGAADRPRQFRKILRIRSARQGHRDFHVPPRWSSDAGTSVFRISIRRIGTKFQVGSTLISKVLTEGGSQTLRVQSPVDGLDRLGSAGALKHFPIVIVATTTVSGALADWRAQTKFSIVAAILSALAIALILFLIIRQITLQNRESQARLKSEKHQLDTALNNMTQGLMLYDASARIVVCNQRYLDLFGLSADIVKPGTRFIDVMRHRKEVGSFKGNVDEFCSNILHNVAQGKITHSTQESGDGRTFAIVNKPLAQGGWVATMEDITERRNTSGNRNAIATMHSCIRSSTTSLRRSR